MAQPTVKVAHLTPIAYRTYWSRTRWGVIGMSAPGWQVQVVKRPGATRFTAEAISDTYGVITIGSAKLQRDAKAIAAEWSGRKWLDYAEAFNTRQEAHFFAPTPEAKARLERWERNVTKGHREAALLGAWTEAEEMAFELAYA